MFQRAILACAVLLLLVPSSQARQKLVFSGKCLCQCVVNETTVIDVLYSNQLSCRPLERKTCNVEVDGVIRSGEVNYCQKVMRWVDVRGLSPVSPDSKPKLRLPRTHVQPSQ
jgi:hypothetical protein